LHQTNPFSASEESQQLRSNPLSESIQPVLHKHVLEESQTIEDSINTQTPLDKIRQEKKLQKMQNKNNNKQVKEMGDSMMRIQKKLDDIQSHRRHEEDTI